MARSIKTRVHLSGMAYVQVCLQANTQEAP